jgi:hypothetical protein
MVKKKRMSPCSTDDGDRWRAHRSARWDWNGDYRTAKRQLLCAINSDGDNGFASTDHDVADDMRADRKVRAGARGAAIYLSLGASPVSLLDFRRTQQDRESDVDLALRLNVLAVLAVFAFVGAVLLGAF